jgi:hypothetical protein
MIAKQAATVLDILENDLGSVLRDAVDDYAGTPDGL